jgi:hypothetical protein
LRSHAFEVFKIKFGLEAGLPDFYRCNTPKREKYTKWPYNLPFGFKTDKMAIKIPTNTILRHSKIYPNWDSWFENTYNIWQHCLEENGTRIVEVLFCSI